MDVAVRSGSLLRISRRRIGGAGILRKIKKHTTRRSWLS